MPLEWQYKLRPALLRHEGDLKYFNFIEIFLAASLFAVIINFSTYSLPSLFSFYSTGGGVKFQSFGSILFRCNFTNLKLVMRVPPNKRINQASRWKWAGKFMNIETSFIHFA